MIIRSETFKDYNAISNITYQAFHNWMKEKAYVNEGILVDMLRHNSMFDPELSLVAEVNNEIVGHVLFSPYKFMLKGKEVKGVILAPISVIPKYQKTGIGNKLIEEGHRILKEKGYELSLLCGHPEYYPRFGYEESTFALTGCKISINSNSINNEFFKERPVEANDIKWISKTWKQMHLKDSFALYPGDTISDWYNHGASSFSSIVLIDDIVKAYIRYNKNGDLKEILSEEEDFEDVLTYVASKTNNEVTVLLAFDQLNSLINNRQIIIEDIHESHNAFMIKVLNESSEVGKYVEAVKSNDIKASVISLPPVFDLDD